VELDSTNPILMVQDSTQSVEDGKVPFTITAIQLLTIPSHPRWAMERTTTQISVWFWPRNDGSVPSEVRNGASDVTPGNWGTPVAKFVNNNCDINSKFGPNNIIINLTLCK
jgi:hypothetical protein